MFERRSSGFASHNPGNDYFRLRMYTFFTRYPGMSWMRDSYPLQRCFHETHNTYHKIDSITFVSRVYRAQYAFATLNKVYFVAPANSPAKSN